MRITMLKVMGVAACSVSEVKVDPYVPLELDFGSVEVGNKLYWRIKDRNASLLEIAVSPKDGRIIGVTLISIDPGKVFRAPLASISGQNVSGVPCVDLALWPRDRREFADKFVDVQGHMQLILDVGRVRLLLGDEGPIQLWCSTTNVQFGTTADGDLACIEVALVSAQETSLLELGNSKF